MRTHEGKLGSAKKPFDVTDFATQEIDDLFKAHVKSFERYPQRIELVFLNGITRIFELENAHDCYDWNVSLTEHSEYAMCLHAESKLQVHDDERSTISGVSEITIDDAAFGGHDAMFTFEDGERYDEQDAFQEDPSVSFQDLHQLDLSEDSFEELKGKNSEGFDHKVAKSMVCKSQKGNGEPGKDDGNSASFTTASRNGNTKLQAKRCIPFVVNTPSGMPVTAYSKPSMRGNISGRENGKETNADEKSPQFTKVLNGAEVLVSGRRTIHDEPWLLSDHGWMRESVIIQGLVRQKRAVAVEPVRMRSIQPTMISIRNAHFTDGNGRGVSGGGRGGSFWKLIFGVQGSTRNRPASSSSILSGIGGMCSPGGVSHSFSYEETSSYGSAASSYDSQNADSYDSMHPSTPPPRTMSQCDQHSRNSTRSAYSQLMFSIDVIYAADSCVLKIRRSLNDIIALHKCVANSNCRALSGARKSAIMSKTFLPAQISICELHEKSYEFIEIITAVSRLLRTLVGSCNILAEDCEFIKIFFSPSKDDIKYMQKELSTPGGLDGMWAEEFESF